MTDKITDKMTEETTEKNTDKITDKMTDKITEKSTDKMTDEMADEMADEMTDKMTDKITEKSTDEMTDKMTDKIIDKIIDKMTEKITDKVTDKITDKVTDKITDKITDKTVDYTNINENDNILDQKFSSKKFFKESQKINIENPEKKDEIINNIREDLMKGNLDSLLGNVTGGEKQDLFAKDNDLIYQITTTENQQNNAYSNISTINLGVCEQTLRGIYNINDSFPLIILKIDYYMSGILIPVIGYEVYHPINKSQLDLNFCNDSRVKMNISVSINEDNLFKHDPHSNYYNDECNAYTTENGTDILINDRQKEFIDNNLSLCENNCSFIGYDRNTKKALCECDIKPEIGLISNIIKNEYVLANDFNTTDDTNSNIAAMKCVHTLFSKEGLLSNIGNYLLLFSLIFFAGSAIIFYKCGYHYIEKDIDKLIALKSNGILNKKSNNKTNIYSKKSKKSLKKFINKKKKQSNPIKKKTKNFHTKFEDKESHKTSSKLKIKSIDARLNLKNSQKSKIIIIKKNKKKISHKSNNDIFKLIKYKHCELNFMNYEKALNNDCRTFSQYYFSLLLSKHVILLSFYLITDYNAKIIKVSLFILSFDIYFAVNTFFFNDTTIHQIYEDEGNYNISFFLPKIFLAFLISYFIILMIRYFSLSERYIIEIRKEEDQEKAFQLGIDSKRKIIIQYIIFYVGSFLFIILFWYYLSSFCAVFQNTQIFVIINTFISFCIGIIFPFLFNLIPGFIRIYSLKKKIKSLYNFNIFLQQY